MDAFNALLTHPDTLVQLVAILHPSVSKQNIGNKQERQLRIEILTEALWTLNNLSLEEGTQ